MLVFGEMFAEEAQCAGEVVFYRFFGEHERCGNGFVRHSFLPTHYENLLAGMRKIGHQLAHALGKQVIVDLALGCILRTCFFINYLIENVPPVGRIAVVGHEFQLRGPHEVMRCRALYPKLTTPFPERLEDFMRQIFRLFEVAGALVAYGQHLFPMQMVEFFKRLVGLNQQRDGIFV